MTREPGLVGWLRRTPHWQFHAVGGHSGHIWRLKVAVELRTRPLPELHVEFGLGPVWLHGSIERQG